MAILTTQINLYIKKSELDELSQKGYALGFQTFIWRGLIVRVETSKILECNTPEDLERLIEVYGIVMLELNE